MQSPVKMTALVDNQAGEGLEPENPGVLSSRRGSAPLLHPNGTPKPIQMPSESMSAIDKLPLEQTHWIQQPIPLYDTIGIISPIPRETNFEDTGGPFYLDPQGESAQIQ